MALVSSRIPWLAGGTDEVLLGGDLTGEHILVPLLAPEVPVVTDQVRVATALARSTGAALQVVNPSPAADGSPAVESRCEVGDGDERDLLDWAVEAVADATGDARSGFPFARRLVDGILRTVAEESVDTLVLPGDSPGGLLRRGAADRIAARADCDVVVVNGQPGFDGVPSILLPVAGGPHSGLAADVARRVAADCGAWVDVLHVVEAGAPERHRERAEEYVDAARRRVARPETTSTWCLEAADPAAAIARQSTYYGLTVLGAPTKGRLRRLVAGSTNQSIRSNADSVVLSVRNAAGGRRLVE